jgi:hypothetical protein
MASQNDTSPPPVPIWVTLSDLFTHFTIKKEHKGWLLIKMHEVTNSKTRQNA